MSDQTLPIDALHSEVDHAAASLAQKHPGRLNCEAGCADCCVDGLSVFSIEAERIAVAVGSGLKDAVAGPKGGCAFLDSEARCRVYDHRPYVCRTQGLPLRWTEDASEGSWVECRDICPKNDEGPPLESLPREACWTLGPFEARLRALQEEKTPGERVLLRQLFQRLASMALGLLVVLAWGAGMPILAQAPPASIVRSGIDVLVEEGFKPLAGRQIALITNHTGLDITGRSSVDLLASAKNLRLVCIMSPEHGFLGRREGSVGDERHEGTGLPIHSLYGKSRSPTAAMLEGVDTLVFDIQDIGCRFYTYISTMKLAMEVAARRKLRFVVLDRPNPIGGTSVQGPMLDPGRESFVSCFRLPIRHGLSVGELAGLFRSELKLDVDLQVIRMKGWRRGMLFDATGQEWRNPSPNMRCLTQALLYPGIGLLETTNLSVGRGTDTPFELIGAPWMRHLEMALRLNAARLPGTRFLPRRFTPETSVFKGESCRGLEIVITDRARFDPMLCGLSIAVSLRALHEDIWQSKRYARLLGSTSVLKGLQAGKTAAELIHSWQGGVCSFLALRRRHLLY